MDGWGFLTVTSQTDRLVMLAVAQKVREWREQEREALAIAIANAVGRLFR